MPVDHVPLKQSRKVVGVVNVVVKTNRHRLLAAACPLAGRLISTAGVAYVTSLDRQQRDKKGWCPYALLGPLRLSLRSTGSCLESSNRRNRRTQRFVLLVAPTMSSFSTWHRTGVDSGIIPVDKSPPFSRVATPVPYRQP